MTAASKDMTLAIPCFNAAKYLPDTLEACLRQTVPPSEILVIDDGSTDDSSAVASNFPVRVLQHGSNLGVAQARNTALENTSTPFLAFVDADASPCAWLVEKMLEELNGEDVVGVGGPGLELESRTISDRWRSVFWQQTHGDRRVDDAWMVMGLCCAFRTEALRLIGGFGPRFRRTAEDVDASLRLRDAGGRLVYNPDMWVMHRRNDTPSSLVRMVAMHSHGLTRAVRLNKEDVRWLHVNAVKWLAVSSVSSLRRHRSMSLAALSVPLGLISIVSRAVAHLQGEGRA